MKKIIHSPLFWIITTIFSAFLYYFSFHFFPTTFPLINLSITMDLKQALEKAKTVAYNNNLGPAEYQSAATFHTDAMTQTFVELEAGGKDAFADMMDKKLYMPYTWQVRHFKEFEKNETMVRFSPDGAPYGFKEVLSEDLPGAQLSEQEAQIIAEKQSTNFFTIELNDYKRVEASQKEQPSKRIDHTFVYERVNEKIGEGLYRLQLCVSGDKLTEVTHFIKIPEAFSRRYTEMRSANTSIAWAATLLMGLLYILLGCGIGFYILIKSRWHMWKQPLKWAIVLAGTQALAHINQLPSLWMYYYSAYATNAFLIQLLLGFFSSFIMQTGTLTVIIMVAEGLTRLAFGNHPQLWSLWLPRNAASYTVLIKTWISYVVISIMCAFVVIFYFISTRYFNWWVPSDVLFNPNILATYVPWFSPIAQSLYAGFLEECLFRAIPLAGAALIGTYCKKRNLFIGIAFVVQALIFGAAHANYPTQPAYGRLIELLIPSFIFGALYLRFGLLPGIITHVVYDLIWFSIPIFVATNSHALYSKIIIIIAALFPLLIIVYARIKQGLWNQIDEMYHNRNWQPIQKTIEQPSASASTIESRITQKTQFIIIFVSCVALIVWSLHTPFRHDGITITKTQKDVLLQADATLKNNAIELPHAWQKLPLFFQHYSHVPVLSMQHRFVWREGKRELYHQLLNTYLQPAHWTVRYAQFEGDLIERAEEYKIMFYDKTRLHHQLPESREGAALTKEDARPIAHHALQTIFNINSTDVEEISAQERQLPHRKNWLFTFFDKQLYPLEKGQARINILISGDKVTDTARIIHVPEEWERTEHNNNHKLGIVNLMFMLCFLFLFFATLFFAHKEYISYGISAKTWGTLCCTMMILFTLHSLNSWQSIIGAFNTSEPWNNQMFRQLGSLFFGILLKALGLSWLCAYTLRQLHHKKSFNMPTILAGYGIGVIIATVLAVIQKIMPQTTPLWPDYSALGTTIPLVSSLIQCLISYISVTAYYLLSFIIINHATHYGQKNTWLLSIVFFFALFLLPLDSFEILPLRCAASIILGLLLLLLYLFIIRYNNSLVPLVVASMFILQTIQQGMFNAYPYAWVSAMVNVVMIAIVSFIWFKRMNSIKTS